MAIKRSDGKWWSDKDPNLKFDTLEMAKEAEVKMVAKPVQSLNRSSDDKENKSRVSGSVRKR